jgi:outer membrane cobalamin receptor
MENTPDFTKDIHVTTVRGLDLQHSYRFTAAYQAVYGFNYVTNFNDSTASAKHDYIVRAGYLENRLDLFEDLNLNFGARLDDYSTFGREISPNFAFRYSLAKGLKLRGLISRSFRAPTFNDLYWPRKDYYYGGFWIGGEEGNPNLKPERGTTGELGIEADINRFISSSLTYYRSDYNDLISWVDESGVWKPKNINSAVIDGIEFQNKIRLTDRLGLDLNYSFLRAKDDKTHKDLIYRPRHKADFSLNYTSRNGFALGLDGQFVGQRFHVIDDPYDGTVKVKQFFVLGLHASKKIKPGVTCTVTIDNLLNRKYQVIRNYPKPGFFIAGILKLEI